MVGLISFPAEPLACPHCGNLHSATCPRIKAIEYYQDGTTKRVEFHSDDYWPRPEVQPPPKLLK